MAKSIDTLVEDIYSLFTNDEEIKIDKKHLDAFAEAVASSVASAISEVRKPREPSLRARHPPQCRGHARLNGPRGAR